MLSFSLRPARISSQAKIQDVVVWRPGGSWNSGMALAVSPDVATKRAGVLTNAMNDNEAGPRVPRISFRSVFEVGGARLAIGHFNRPLADEECRSLRRAWKRARLPEVVDFEVSPKQVSFLTPPPRVAATWRSIDSLLAATSSLAKAS